MRVFTGSRRAGANRSAYHAPNADIIVLEPPLAVEPVRLLRAVELHPTRGKLDAEIAEETARTAPPLSAVAAVLPRFAIRGHSRRGVARLQLTGHLGLSAGPLIQVWLAQAELASRDLVVLDLRNLTSMDDAGFLICLRAWEHAKLCGLRLKLTNCRGDARRLVDATETGELFGAPSSPGGDPPREDSGNGWSPILIPQVRRDQ